MFRVSHLEIFNLLASEFSRDCPLLVVLRDDVDSFQASPGKLEATERTLPKSPSLVNLHWCATLFEQRSKSSSRD
jgi:hypothetical protein